MKIAACNIGLVDWQNLTWLYLPLEPGHSMNRITSPWWKHVMLETDRLMLRRWQLADKPPFAAMCSDREVMRYIGDGSTRSPPECFQLIDRFEQHWDQRGYSMFAVEFKETSTLIGFTGFSHPEFLPEILPAVEIGWRFVRSHWGKGYATEAATAALAFGVNDLGLREIVSICQVGNIGSKKVMEKIGLSLDRQTIDPTCGREVDVYRL